MATGNHLLVQLKANQPTLQERLPPPIPRTRGQDRYPPHELGRHSRIERRTTRVWALPPGAGTEDWHDHFRALIEGHRRPAGFDTRQKDWIERQETAYYLSTVTLSATAAAQVIRAHGGIENRLHYVRDVSLGEDGSRIRRHPRALRPTTQLCPQPAAL